MGITKKINKRKRLEVSFTKEFKKFINEYYNILKELEKYKETFENVINDKNSTEAIQDFAKRLLNVLNKQKVELLKYKSVIESLKDKDKYSDKEKEEIINIIKECKLIQATMISITMDWVEFCNAIVEKVEEKKNE